MSEWGKWIRDSFDKFMLCVLSIGQIFLVVWMIRKGLGAGGVSWAQNIASTVLGALLTLITRETLTKTESSTTGTSVNQAPGSTTNITTKPADPPPEG